ncbi:MAG: Gfo/Idh/MocA family oxidoreductase [Candidatus Hydrogenedentota bacterium]
MNAGLIGCGLMGALHAEMAHACGIKVVACADASLSAARDLALRIGAKAYNDADAILDRRDVEIIIIATPTPTHLELVQAAASAGKHIFCEKPLARTTADAREAVQAAKRAGVKLFVGHVVRYFHEFEAIRAQIESDKIGKPGFVKTFRGGALPGGAGKWFQDFEKSGGAVFDMLIHDFDWIRYVFGPVRRVFCQSLMKTEPVVLDYALVTLRLKSGVIAQVVGSWAHPSGFRVRAEVCGSGGMIQYDSAQTPISIAPRAGAKGATGTIVPSSPIAESPYLLEWRDFAGWLADGKAPRLRPEDAVEAVRIAEAALTSNKTGQPVALN